MTSREPVGKEQPAACAAQGGEEQKHQGFAPGLARLSNAQLTWEGMSGKLVKCCFTPKSDTCLPGMAQRRERAARCRAQ